MNRRLRRRLRAAWEWFLILMAATLFVGVFTVPTMLVDGWETDEAKAACVAHQGVARIDLEATPTAYRCRDGFEGVVR